MIEGKDLSKILETMFETSLLNQVTPSKQRNVLTSKVNYV